jgi:hypothetical protein
MSRARLHIQLRRSCLDLFILSMEWRTDVAFRTRSMWLMPALCMPMLAACETAPAGPGRTIDAAQSSIQFNHPLYPSANGEYTQRSGGHNSQVETAMITGPQGAVFIAYHHSAGDTYFSTPDVEELARSIGTTPEDNEIKAEGELENTFPVVRWVSYRATSDGQPMSCVSIAKNGDGAGSAGGGAYASELITATECRDPSVEMTEQDAAALSGSVRTR